MMSRTTDVLPRIGLEFIVKVVRIIVGTFCYGIYILLFVSSVRVLRRRARNSIPALILFFILTVMFAASTLFLVMDIIDIIVRFKILLMSHSKSAMPDFKRRLDRADSVLGRLVWTGEMLFIFMLVFGDSVVVWRTWAFYYDSRYYIVLPALTWTGSAVAALYELGCDIHAGWKLQNDGPSAGSLGAASCAKADTIGFSLSYATNIICTLLIFLQTWRYRRGLRQFMGKSRRRTQIEKMLVLLVESGTIYLVIYTFQALPIYGKAFNSHSLIIVEAINAIVQQAIGMYPTSIVVLVELQKSLLDTETFSYEFSSSAQFTSLVFSTQPSQTVEDIENIPGAAAPTSNGPSTSDIMLTPLKQDVSQRSLATVHVPSQ